MFRATMCPSSEADDCVMLPPYAIRLTEFKHVNQEHLHFVEPLLQILCTLGICCAVSEHIQLTERECSVRVLQ